jgi:perosamine synthetase
MHARLRLDLSWPELGLGAAALLLPGDVDSRTRRIERLAGERGTARVALSVRSGLEAFLTAAGLPPGSEVLVSAWTVPHMTGILRAHGLVPVPFALDPDTLAPAEGELERLATARTRAVLFAHLFGVRADLRPTLALARARGWLLLEDAAQALASDDWRGTAGADVTAFSFGLIKTRTAIQGGLLHVADENLRQAFDAVQARWPRAARLDFARRLVRAAALHVLARPGLLARYARRVQRRGGDLDEVLHAASRAFPGDDWLERLRRRPSLPLLALLERRLRHPERSQHAGRRADGERLLAELGPEVPVLGRRAPYRGHWVFAVRAHEPAALVADLRARGLDATARSSLEAVRGADGQAAPGAAALLESLVFVPLVPGLEGELRAVRAGLVRTWCRPRTIRARSGDSVPRIGQGRVGADRQVEAPEQQQQRDPGQREGQRERHQRGDQGP